MPARSFSVNWSHLERLSAVDDINSFVLELLLNNVASFATLTAALASATASAAAAATTASSLVRSVSEAKASKYFAYKYKEVIKRTSNHKLLQLQKKHYERVGVVVITLIQITEQPNFSSLLSSRRTSAATKVS